MNQFNTILVPLDGSGHDPEVVITALDLALRHSARLVLMFVIEQPEPVTISCAHGGPTAGLRLGDVDNLAEERNSAMSYLDEIRHRYHLFANVEVVVRSGDPVRQIETEAASRPRPLVVLGIEPDDQNPQHALLTRASRLTHRGRLQLMLVSSIQPSCDTVRRDVAANRADFATV